jgi:hypothetical protein
MEFNKNERQNQTKTLEKKCVNLELRRKEKTTTYLTTFEIQ